MKNYKISTSVLLFLVLISGIIYSQSFIEEHKTDKNAAILYFVPKKEHLPFAHFGFKSVTADLMWLRGVSYFMNNMGRNSDYKYLFGMFNASIILDPKFKQVYRDAMTFFVVDKEYYPEAEKIILAGIDNRPDDWELYYMAGTLYAYYIKDDNKSLMYFDRCWARIPKTEEYLHEIENINVIVRSITEKKNDKKGLILYWLNKFNVQENKSSKEYCKLQIQKYVSMYMQEKLNAIQKDFTLEEDRNKQLTYAIEEFKVFYVTNNISVSVDVPLEELFSSKDAFGYRWVYSERESKIYSFGNAQEFLGRKLNLYNFKLWGKLGKVLANSTDELLSYYPSERTKHLKLKPEYSEWPKFEELYDEKADWLKLEYPLFPIYENGFFRIPEYKELPTIDKKYK